jgi:copper homeostasis protein CutC
MGGAELLREADERIVIMSGSGVRASNIVELQHLRGLWSFTCRW